MNSTEKRMTELLHELRNNHGAIAIKADFEAECTRMEEALRVRDLIASANLSLTVKIGGCEALKDLFEAKCLGASRIVAPMIESPFALKKFAAAIPSLFSQEEIADTQFFANIESVTGFEKLDAILAEARIAKLDGVVMGRVDTAASLNLQREDADSPLLENIGRELVQKATRQGLQAAIGGAVSTKTLGFFRTLPPNALNSYETRKVIFSASNLSTPGVAEKALSLAAEFEILWLENKRAFYEVIAQEDNTRIKMMRERLSKLSLP